MLLLGVASEWCLRTLRVTLLFMIAAGFIFLDAAPARRHHHRPRVAAVTVELPDLENPGRWVTPCAGSTDAESPDTDAADTTPSDRVDLLASEHGRRKIRRRLARQMARLADRVDRLKQRYADHRFRDSVDTLDQLGFQLEGMPTPTPSETDGQVDDVILRALVDLTRVAPWLELALDGERRYERGRNFVADYRHVLNDVGHGFYWILCQLHRLQAAVDGPSAAGWTAAVADVTYPGAGALVQSNAIRHYRDYVVLRDFGRLLDAYRRQLWHPRFHSSRRPRVSRDVSQV